MDSHRHIERVSRLATITTPSTPAAKIGAISGDEIRDKETDVILILHKTEKPTSSDDWNVQCIDADALGHEFGADSSISVHADRAKDTARRIISFAKTTLTASKNVQILLLSKDDTVLNEYKLFLKQTEKSQANRSSIIFRGKEVSENALKQVLQYAKAAREERLKRKQRSKEQPAATSSPEINSARNKKTEIDGDVAKNRSTSIIPDLSPEDSVDKTAANQHDSPTPIGVDVDNHGKDDMDVDSKPSGVEPTSDLYN